VTDTAEFETDASVVAHAAWLAAEPRDVTNPDSGEKAFMLHSLPEHGKVAVTDVAKLLEPYRDRPRRKKGSYAVHSGESLVKYLERHATDDTEVWADVLSTTITAVINAHGPVDETPGWGDHRAVYAVKFTDAWEAWSSVDGEFLDQVTFAELVEDRAIDIVDPAAADMLEIVQQFQAHTGVEFESKTRLNSGETRLVYKETIEARTSTGNMEVPTEFTLRIKPFEGADPQNVTARLRFRIQHKQLALGIKLDRPDDIVRDAFESVISNVESQITWPVFRGTSA
jgi:uncharacterized protein YfdQ (DUF2303 family)